VLVGCGGVEAGLQGAEVPQHVLAEGEAGALALRRARRGILDADAARRSSPRPRDSAIVPGPTLALVSDLKTETPTPFGWTATAM
jgi:hypothetical protein